MSLYYSGSDRVSADKSEEGYKKPVYWAGDNLSDKVEHIAKKMFAAGSDNRNVLIMAADALRRRGQ